jgi:hypothetical protein
VVAAALPGVLAVVALLAAVAAVLPGALAVVALVVAVVVAVVVVDVGSEYHTHFVFFPF